VINPILWLILSFLLVSISLTAVLVVLVPAVRELSRAARSVEKLCETLSQELPPTLESIRLTSLEITELTDDMSEGVQNATRVAHQVDQSVHRARHQAHRVQVSTRSLMVGVQTAWKTLTQPNGPEPRRLPKGASAKYAAPQKTMPAVRGRNAGPDSLSSQRPRSAASERSRSTAPTRPGLPSGNQPEAQFPPASPSSAPDPENPTEINQSEQRSP
jgi:uncharacterized protein YoxC